MTSVIISPNGSTEVATTSEVVAESLARQESNAPRRALFVAGLSSALSIVAVAVILIAIGVTSRWGEPVSPRR